MNHLITRSEAILALDVLVSDTATEVEKRVAYARLLDLIYMLLT